MPQNLPKGVQYEVKKCTIHDMGTNTFEIVSDGCPNTLVQGRYPQTSASAYCLVQVNVVFCIDRIERLDFRTDQLQFVDLY